MTRRDFLEHCTELLALWAVEMLDLFPTLRTIAAETPPREIPPTPGRGVVSFPFAIGAPKHKSYFPFVTTEGDE